MPIIRANGNQSGVLIGVAPAVADPPYGAQPWEMRDKLAETLQALRNRGVIAPAGGITLDYYSYLLSLNPWMIAPLNDLASTVLNTAGTVIGSYTGIYSNNQANLISKLANARSTRFNGGGIGLNAIQGNPQFFTLVARVSLSSTAAGSLFGFSNVVGFSGESSFDRELFLDPSNGNRPTFRVFTAAEVRIATPATYRDGIARTIVVRRDSTLTSIWVDGIKIVEQAVGAIANYSGYWKVAYSRTGGLANGINMQGVAIYNTALNDSQIAAIQSFV